MWLLEAYHGQCIEYRLITQLFDFAREQGRALAFYRKVGCYEIPCYNDGVAENSMEATLSKQ